MKNFAILICITICSMPLLGQTYFNNVYDDVTHTSESATNIVIMQNGNYLVPSAAVYAEGDLLGGYFLREIGLDGNEIIQINPFNTIDDPIYVNYAESIISTSDGGYIQATANDFAYLVKFNEDLTLDWDLSVDSISGFYRAIELANGQFLICGYTYATNKIELLWLNQDGVVQSTAQVDPFDESLFYQINSTVQRFSSLWPLDMLVWETSSICLSIATGMTGCCYVY